MIIWKRFVIYFKFNTNDLGLILELETLKYFQQVKENTSINVLNYIYIYIYIYIGFLMFKFIFITNFFFKEV